MEENSTTNWMTSPTEWKQCPSCGEIVPNLAQHTCRIYMPGISTITVQGGEFKSPEMVKIEDLERKVDELSEKIDRLLRQRG